MKKYRLKKEVKRFLVETMIVSILFITPILVAVGSLKKDFNRCDIETGKTCTIYDVHRVGK